MPYVLYPFCRKNPGAHIPETAFPDPYLFTETENPIVDAILALLSKTRLILPQSFNVFERSGQSVVWEQRSAKGMMS